MKIAALFLSAACLAAAEKPELSTEIKPRLPALSSVFPQGSNPGATLRVEVLGEYLDRASAVIFLDGTIRGRVLDGSYTRLALEFIVDAGAPLGPHYFRIVSPRGASNILLFRVGDQPHISEVEPNSTFEQAQSVTIPATINGRLNVDGDFDFFKFRVEKGQTWIFDLRSARNGNGLDPALILLDSRRRKLIHVEDTFIWDPFFSYTFAESGDYYAVIQPTHRANDPNFGYQLDIRTAPYLETISPLSVRPGATTEATVFGAALAGAGAKLQFDAPGFSGEVLEMRGSQARVRIVCPAEAAEGKRQLTVVTAGGVSNPAAFLVDATPPAAGEIIAPPVSITGTARYRQPERFSFDVKAGDTLVFEVRAQRFGSPVDSIVRILDAAGKQIAMNDDGDYPGAQFNKDSYLVHKFAKEGRYQVEIRNLWKTTGEDFPYVLLVHPPKPAYELTWSADNPYVYPGEKGSIKVTAVRREGFDGPIQAQLTGAASGVTAGALEIPAGKNEGSILIQAEPGALGSHAQIRVSDDGHTAWRSVRIASGGGEGATFAKVDQATLAVVEKPLFSLEASVTQLNLVRGSSAEFEVNIRRAKDFAEDISFFFENLPPGVTMQPTRAAASAGRAKIRLTADKTAGAGRFARVAVLGRAEGGQVQEAPRIGIVID